MKKRVLHVLHNHPSLAPGGAETYAMDVYRSLRRSEEFEPLLLARADPGRYGGAGVDDETRFVAFGGDRDQLLAVVPEERYDKFLMRMGDQGELARKFAHLLREERPDVIHFHHALFLGAELISVARRTLPQAAVVFTLHEFLPICNHYGQLVRTFGGLCTHDSPRRCHQCFPEISPQDFFLRKHMLQSHFDQVDTFIAPSRFALEQYVRWGIPRPRLRFEPHGFDPVRRLVSEDRSPRSRFAFFGVLTPFKGVDVLLRAMEQLGPDFEGRLTVHGASYAAQPEDARAELARLFDRTSATVTNAGPYDRATLPRLMAETDWVVVPSIWWENSPLVIQEAFMHGRPVICSDIGGMAEHVRHQVDGLQFPVGSADALADTMREAVAQRDLWARLQAQIPAVRTMEEHVSALGSIYRRALERRSAGAEPAPAAVTVRH
jgi:glycosyltransferase involved in cell wall biosynthesis